MGAGAGRGQDLDQFREKWVAAFSLKLVENNGLRSIIWLSRT
jgi:hypothetical protein